HNESSFEPKDLYPVVLSILQGYYLVRQKVHERAVGLFAVDRTASRDEQRRLTRAFWADQLLLASAVVASAARLRCPQKYKQFIGFLHSATRVSAIEIDTYGRVIVNVLFNKDTRET
ncbi:hypothetical protein V5799_025727, partial [Amblyomma americanum]